MLTLIGFEFHKFFKRKKNIVSIFFFVLIVILFVFSNNRLEHRRISNRLFECENNIHSYENMLNSLELEYQEKKLPKLQLIIDSTKQTISLLNQQKEAIKSHDEQMILESNVALDKHLLQQVQSDIVYENDGPMTIENRIETNQYLLDHGIESMNLQYSMKSYNFLNLFARDIIPFILIISIFLYSADAVSYEMDDGTYKILMTQSISKKKLILAKWISYIMINVIVTFSIILGAFLILGYIKGFGSASFPISILSKGGEQAQMITIKSFNFMILPMFFLLIILLVSISILVSTIASNSLIAIGCSIIIYTAIYFIKPMLSSFGKSISILPFIYFDIPSILDGTTRQLYDNPNITYTRGCISFIVTSLICIIVSLIVIHRKEFRA